MMPGVPHDGLCVAVLDCSKPRITESLKVEKISKITQTNS